MKEILEKETQNLKHKTILKSNSKNFDAVASKRLTELIYYLEMLCVCCVRRRRRSNHAFLQCVFVIFTKNFLIHLKNFSPEKFRKFMKREEFCPLIPKMAKILSLDDPRPSKFANVSDEIESFNFRFRPLASLRCGFESRRRFSSPFLLLHSNISVISPHSRRCLLDSICSVAGSRRQREFEDFICCCRRPADENEF